MYVSEEREKKIERKRWWLEKREKKREKKRKEEAANRGVSPNVCFVTKEENSRNSPVKVCACLSDVDEKEFKTSRAEEGGGAVSPCPRAVADQPNVRTSCDQFSSTGSRRYAVDPEEGTACREWERTDVGKRGIGIGRIPIEREGEAHSRDAREDGAAPRDQRLREGGEGEKTVDAHDIPARELRFPLHHLELGQAHVRAKETAHESIFNIESTPRTREAVQKQQKKPAFPETHRQLPKRMRERLNELNEWGVLLVGDDACDDGKKDAYQPRRSSPKACVRLQSKKVEALVDTGADISVIS